MTDQALRAVRTRWAALGAAIAISIGGGGIAISQAAISTGDRDVYVPIVPCRAFDTRSGDVNVGPRSTAIAAGETYTQQITGINGNCTTPIPSDATAVAMNVTAVGGTAAGFLTVWPSDVTPRPTVSNLNWTPGSPPTPNKVDTKLSPTGQINLFNNAGTVDVLADIVGYYTDHNHDDRYYPRAEIYNKSETYNKTETYNKSETYNKTETDAQFTTKAEVAAAPYSDVLAGGYIFGNGNLSPDKSFGNIASTRLGLGSYQISLPAYNAGCTGAPTPFLTATMVAQAGFALADPGTGTDCVTGDTFVFVKTTDGAGAAADRDFTFAIYSDS
ncbi:MAG: hypothetical protein JJD93_18800 [Ilumatobacteraceae bacterium]|nr:hypothetical protein [Ilumatobacteraceae bacterium]